MTGTIYDLESRIREARLHRTPMLHISLVQSAGDDEGRHGDAAKKIGDRRLTRGASAAKAVRKTAGIIRQSLVTELLSLFIGKLPLAFPQRQAFPMIDKILDTLLLDCVRER